VSYSNLENVKLKSSRTFSENCVLLATPTCRKFHGSDIKEILLTDLISYVLKEAPKLFCLSMYPTTRLKLILL